MDIISLLRYTIKLSLIKLNYVSKLLHEPYSKRSLLKTRKEILPMSFYQPWRKNGRDQEMDVTISMKHSVKG